MQLLCHRRSWITFAAALSVGQAARAEWAWIWSSDPAANAVELRQEFTAPAGARRANLLNGLNPEEVLDLLGYVLSGGDPEHALFKAHSAGR